MTRLAPQLEDYWTEQKTTHLSWAEPIISGIGLSLDIWSKLFDFTDGSWFADLSGAHHDTLVLVSLHSDIASTLPKIERFTLSEAAQEAGNVSLLADSYGFYQLEATVLDAIGCSRPDAIGISDSVLATVLIHDNFLFSFARQESGIERDVVRLVLQVHQHYLAQDFVAEQEEELLERIIDTLSTERGIELVSKPLQKELCISYERPLEGWLNRILDRREKHSMCVPIQSDCN